MGSVGGFGPEKGTQVREPHPATQHTSTIPETSATQEGETTPVLDRGHRVEDGWAGDLRPHITPYTHLVLLFHPHPTADISSGSRPFFSGVLYGIPSSTVRKTKAQRREGICLRTHSNVEGQGPWSAFCVRQGSLWPPREGQLFKGGSAALTEAGGQSDCVAPVQTGFGARVLRGHNFSPVGLAF